jgi:hypothetical protein
MSFNLPPNRLLKLIKGSWADVRYPVRAVVQATLTPRDFFEPVDPQSPRSCVPAGGRDFSSLFDANSGGMVLRGPSMFPPVSVTFQINDGSWDIIFVGRVMQLSQSIDYEADLDPMLTHFEQTIPALLSVATGLSIFAETVEIALGDKLEARVEVLIPPNSFRVIAAETRVDELRSGIEMLGFALSSAGFILASSYLQEAIFFDASYNAHNPYTHSLVVLLRCAQAVEILFGGQRDAIREKCQILEVPDDVIESQIIPISVARHTLGSAHASSFVPKPSEVEILRNFAHRSVHTVRQLLLHISRVDPERRSFIMDTAKRSREKEKLFAVLQKGLQARLWSVEGDIEVRDILVPDPRLAGPTR